MRTIGNVIWIIFGGLFMCICWLFAGLLCCITVIGIPFGKQCFKIAKLMLAPFGKKVHTHFGKHPIANIIWLILLGWELAIGFLGCGILCCITIVGIPFGLQSIKLMQLAFAPFGATV